MTETGGILKIMHAGALRRPIGDCLHIFRRRFRGTKIDLQAAGSRECARRILTGEPFDVVVLADPAVFAEFLVPDFVGDYFVFATDQIVIGYSRYGHQYRSGKEINDQNWMDVLLADGVSFGRSDEHLDPCGYRTLMVWQLAEDYYRRPGLAALFQQQCRLMYAKSIDLVAPLMEGGVDYAFIYASEARQVGLPYVVLPSPINLAHPAYADYYGRAAVTVRSKDSGGTTIVRGTPIEFAVAVSRKAENPGLAASFIELLTDDEGQQVLENNGLIPC